MNWTICAHFAPALEKEFAVLLAGLEGSPRRLLRSTEQASLFFSNPAYAIDTYAKDNH